MKTIVLDCDGVMVDYISAYVNVWEKVFGEKPELVNPNAYWAKDRYSKIRDLSDKELFEFKSHFDCNFWRKVPALPGAVEACNALADAGYKIIVVSALSKLFEIHRYIGLKEQGFNIEGVIAVGDPTHSYYDNPKCDIVNSIRPIAFVDDFLPYHQGVHPVIHKALVTRGADGGPNTGFEAVVNSAHPDLVDFVDWFLPNAKK